MDAHVQWTQIAADHENFGDVGENFMRAPFSEVPSERPRNRNWMQEPSLLVGPRPVHQGGW
jgi:hypothetical protein